MAAVLSYEDANEILLRWQKSGPTAAEHDEFVDEALAQLSNQEQVTKFEKNISEIADAAAKIDKVFNDIDRSFDWLARIIYAILFPELINYYNEWSSFKERFRNCLHRSTGVATDSIDFLSRFDTVYLTKVEQIQTDQDRIDAISALEQFTNEEHDGSVQMSHDFLTLKRDIDAFMVRFNQWIVDKGVALEQRAKQLKIEIDGLQRDIEVLDGKIKDAKKALAIAGGFLFFIGLAVAGGVLASFESQRRSKVNELRSKQTQLDIIKLQQDLLGQFKSGFDGVKPDIALMCDKLVVFAETWASVRSQAVQFRQHLLGGMEAVTNLRFKKEVQLARAVCLPLIEGLKKYKGEIENPRHWI